jgi:phthiodiolone/phenolphthiodiolone dimycocerosates ketoreductase
MREVLTGVNLWGSRYAPIRIAGAMARRIEASGHVDQVIVWDQLMNWFPQHLWTAENTPLAAIAPDVDSINDPFATLCFALAATEGRVGFGVGTDMFRRNPSELAQMLLTLATTTTGQGSFYLGAGEAKNVVPFGHKRSRGLMHLEDGLQVLRKLLKEDHKVDHDGRVWTLRDAFLGNGGKDRKPQVITMGGGPRLIDSALSYADGLAVGVPFVTPYADDFAEFVTTQKQALEERGRDPEAFEFGAIHMLFVCESEDAFEQYVDNPLLKFFAATAGRLDMHKWEREGIESVMPLDWHYAFKMLSGSYTRDEVYAITDKVTPEMVRKTYHIGSPAEIAAKIRPFTDAGATRHAFADVSALLIAQDPTDAVEGMIEVSRLVKAGDPSLANTTDSIVTGRAE